MFLCKKISLIMACVFLASCASMPKSSNQIQLLRSDSTLVNGCTKLGPIYSDTRGNPFNFDSLAESEFNRIAVEKYQADSAVITTYKDMGLGRIILQGTALKCYS